MKEAMGDKSGVGEVTESYVAVDDRYMQLPSFLRGPLALISTRSGTRLEKTSPSAGGLKCPLEKTVSRI